MTQQTIATPPNPDDVAPPGASSNGFVALCFVPIGRGREIAKDSLQAAGIMWRDAADMADVARQIDEDTPGLVLLAEDDMTAEESSALAHALDRQPAWSDVPIVVLARRGRPAEGSVDFRGNVTLVERPVRRATLAVAVRQAVRVRRRQLELRDLLLHMDEMLRRLADADRRRDEFLAALSHELRTPMAAARNALEVLRLTLPPAGRHERPVEIIGRQMENLKRLVDDLLDVSRVTTGRVDLDLVTTDLRDVARRSVQALDAEARAAGHTLNLRLTPWPAWVKGDPVRLEQIIANLITNSIKYTSWGGHIDVVVDREPGVVVVRVRDDGIGIDAELLPRVFDLFAQAAQPLDRARGGLGVGLHLVRTLVHHHGGTIQAHSDGPGRGSEFVARVPVAPPPQAAAPDQVAESSSRALVIAVVEDDTDTREMLVDALRFRGHAVESASSGTTGLDLTLELHPDVALIDLGLPGIDGFALARRVREAFGSRSPRMIAVSGYSQERDYQRAVDAGFHDLLIKPVRIEELNRHLEGLPLAD